jgi:hypothetical protein
VDYTYWNAGISYSWKTSRSICATTTNLSKRECTRPSGSTSRDVLMVANAYAPFIPSDANPSRTLMRLRLSRFDAELARAGTHRWVEMTFTLRMM